MKKLIILVALVLGLSSVSIPAMATNSTSTFGVDTAILKKCGKDAEDKNGEGIKCVLALIVDIMTIGIGILGVLGITIVGIQYLTAGGNEEKTRKAKRRMFEIVIGLVAYVLIFAILNWLLKDYQPFGS